MMSDIFWCCIMCLNTWNNLLEWVFDTSFKFLIVQFTYDTVATGIATRQRTKKENVLEKRFGVSIIVIFGKLWKTIK